MVTSEDTQYQVMFLIEDCAIEFVDAKIPVCQYDRLTIYDSKPFFDYMIIFLTINHKCIVKIDVDILRRAPTRMYVIIYLAQ